MNKIKFGLAIIAILLLADGCAGNGRYIEKEEYIKLTTDCTTKGGVPNGDLETFGHSSNYYYVGCDFPK